MKDRVDLRQEKCYASTALVFFSMVAVLFQCSKDSMINLNTISSPNALSTLFVFTNRISWGAILTK